MCDDEMPKKDFKTKNYQVAKGGKKQFNIFHMHKRHGL